VHALEKTFEALRKLALAYPETREDHPWGESAIKVRGKTFLFMGLGEGKLGLSLKLTHRLEFALQYPFVTPTRYGLGKSGWVTANFSGKDKPPMDVLEAWIDESYLAIAPKKLSAALEAARASS
jgi:predicted DNA-binding protein (MmcQ/YjbR family)